MGKLQVIKWIELSSLMPMSLDSLARELRAILWPGLQLHYINSPLLVATLPGGA